MSGLSPEAITSFWGAGVAAVLQGGADVLMYQRVRPALALSAAAGPVLGYATTNFLLGTATTGEETAGSAAAGAVLGYMNGPAGSEAASAGMVAAASAAGCLIGKGIDKL